MHRSQEDEALRQARDTDKIRDSLRWIADKLRNRGPQHLMTEEARIAVALSASCVAYPRDDAAAEELERQILQRMPYADAVTTRGEYALQLDKASWRAAR